jgi:hypothetical protein
LVKNLKARRKMQRTELWALAIKAWNAGGKPIGHLKYIKGESLPEIEVPDFYEQQKAA